MGFQVTYGEALRDAWGVLFLAAIGLVLLIVAGVAWRRANRNIRQVLTVVTGSVGILLLALTLWLPYSVAGKGWFITNMTSTTQGSATNQSSETQSSSSDIVPMLTVKTGFGSVTWPLAGIQARYVTNDAAYATARRTGGYGGGQLQTGRFRLQNGDSVLMFRYGNHPRLLLTYVGTESSGSTGQNGTGQAGNTENGTGQGTTNASTGEAASTPGAQGNQPQVLISSPNVDSLYTAINAAHQGQGIPPNVGVIRPSSTGVHVANVVIAILVGLVSLAIQAGMSIRFFPHLPANVAAHWNIWGEVDNRLPKRVIVWLGPILALVFGAIGVAIAFVPGSIFLQTPFWAMQILFLYINWWMYRKNAGGMV